MRSGKRQFQKELFTGDAGSRLLRVAQNLVLSESLGPAQKITAHYGSPEAIFRAPVEELMAFGLDKERASALTSPSLLKEARRVLDWVAKKGYFVLTAEDEDYPKALLEIFEPPAVLYGAGNPEVLKEPAVAVVGARRPTPYGRAVAERLSRDLAACGLVVVSGMAAGIDSLAHWGAVAEGRTVAVLGSGLDVVYPPENKGLFRKIAERGAVISEFAPGTPPLGFHFPLRNRIISGLCLAVVVVEAAERSGSLITARLALDQGREVMAVPGNVTSGLSRGCHWLLQSGAKLVETWEDVVEEFSSPLQERFLRREEEERKKRPELSPEERMIFDCLKTDELTHIDELAERSAVSVSEILAILLNLELKGLVHQVPGKHFQRSL
ncbi:MAG: DNA-protecting protein DprA [Candidatus Aminicenantes bacterium]|nr:DNA-protecting protein DprA [Candidatus Aminicenantes bacterium]